MSEMLKEANRLKVLAEEFKRLVASPMKEKGLFGKAIKEKANSGPVLWHGPRVNEESGFHTGDSDVDFLGWMFGGKKDSVANMIDPKAPKDQNILTRLYSRFGNTGVIDSANLQHGRHKKPGVIFDIDGSARETRAGKGVWDAANMGRDRVDVSKDLAELYPDATRLHVEPSSFRGDKLREAKAVPGINDTKTLAQIFPRGIPRSSDKARLALERAFGPNWIVKAREGLASADTNLTDHAVGKELLDRLRAAVREQGGLSRVIAQHRSDAQEVGPIRKLMDDMAEDAGIGMKKKEYRVHVVNGKVVPYATYGRGNVADYLNTVLNPFRTREVRNVEEAVQKAVNRMPNAGDRTRASYGFDVGVDKAGKPFIVETNPSEGSIASSWFSSPFVADSVVSATRGKLPAWVKARNSFYGAGALGLGGLGVNHMSKEGADSSTSETIGRIGLGALAADTGWNAVQIGRQAFQMENLHNKGIRAALKGGLGTGDKARFLQQYADHAGEALNRRVLGIPVHLLLRGIAPSADATIMERLRQAVGKPINSSAAKNIEDARAHYKGFAKTPRLAMLREIMTDDPTATSMAKAPRTSAGRAVQKAMAGKGAEPDLRALFGAEAFKDPHLAGGVNKRFSEFFLGGQKNIGKGFSWVNARRWGMTPYAKAMKPAAGIMGLLSMAGMAAALRGGKD